MGSSTNFASATASELEKLGTESALGEAERERSRYTLPAAVTASVSKYATATEPVAVAGAKIEITAIVSDANTTAPVTRRSGQPVGTYTPTAWAYSGWAGRTTSEKIRCPWFETDTGRGSPPLPAN